MANLARSRRLQLLAREYHKWLHKCRNLYKDYDSAVKANNHIGYKGAEQYRIGLKLLKAKKQLVKALDAYKNMTTEIGIKVEEPSSRYITLSVWV